MLSINTFYINEEKWIYESIIYFPRKFSWRYQSLHLLVINSVVQVRFDTSLFATNQAVINSQQDWLGNYSSMFILVWPKFASRFLLKVYSLLFIANWWCKIQLVNIFGLYDVMHNILLVRRKLSYPLFFIVSM